MELGKLIFAQALFQALHRLYAIEDLDLGLDNEGYVLDATTIDVWLSVFPWLKFEKQRQ